MSLGPRTVQWHLRQSLPVRRCLPVYLCLCVISAGGDLYHSAMGRGEQCSLPKTIWEYSFRLAISITQEQSWIDNPSPSSAWFLLFPFSCPLPSSSAGSSSVETGVPHSSPGCESSDFHRLLDSWTMTAEHNGLIGNRQWQESPQDRISLGLAHLLVPHLILFCNNAPSATSNWLITRSRQIHSEESCSLCQLIYRHMRTSLRNLLTHLHCSL